MFDDLMKGLGEARDKMIVPASLLFLSWFFGTIAVVASLYTFANNVTAKGKK